MSIATEITALQTNLQNAKDAVTAKGGTVGNTGLAGLSTEIATIPAGGGKAPNKYDPYRFFDYDGTLLYSYTEAEMANLTSLPAAPSHCNMVSDGWTHTLAEVKAHKYNDVGAIYHSGLVDADTSWFKIYPHSANSANQVTLSFQQDVANGVTIDWGDGSVTETVAGTGNVTASHTYDLTDQTIYPCYLTMTPSSGTTLTLGQGAELTSLFGATAYSWNGKGSIVRDALIGKAKFAYYALYGTDLHSCAISNRVSGALPAGVFGRCQNLTGIVVPVNLTYDSSYSVFTYCYRLSNMVYGPTCVYAYGSGSSQNDSNFQEVVVIPSTVKQMDLTYTKAKIYRFQNKSAGSGWWVKLDNSIVGVATVLDFRDNTVVARTYSNVSSLPASLKVVVPDTLYDSWKASAYWSGVAGNIMKASDYEAYLACPAQVDVLSPAEPEINIGGDVGPEEPGNESPSIDVGSGDNPSIDIGGDAGPEEPGDGEITINPDDIVVTP